MKNDKTKLNLTTTTLKSTMHHKSSDQETVFALAASPRLKRPYGRYGAKRKKRNHTPNNALNSNLSASQAQGQEYELLAINYLQMQGMVLIARNLRCKSGEIDCVMLHYQTLVFVEVRQRSRSSYGDAAASIDKQKQQRLRQSANYFLPQLCQQLALKEIPLCRFDVVTFDGKEQSFQWLRNAFI
ncbi:MAG: YraN family protein [Alcaligenaceae bacterium]|nr:YraN family protein [Alcaligenaceae bacterium]